MVREIRNGVRIVVGDSTLANLAQQSETVKLASAQATSVTNEWFVASGDKVVLGTALGIFTASYCPSPMSSAVACCMLMQTLTKQQLSTGYHAFARGRRCLRRREVASDSVGSVYNPKGFLTN